MTAKQYLHLLRLSKRTSRENLDVLDLEAKLFTQLASKSIDRLFTSFKKTTGQAPTTARAKSVFEQKYLSCLIKNKGAGRDSETRVRESHAPATQARGQAAIHITNEILKTTHG